MSFGTFDCFCLSPWLTGIVNTPPLCRLCARRGSRIIMHHCYTSLTTLTLPNVPSGENEMQSITSTRRNATCCILKAVTCLFFPSTIQIMHKFITKKKIPNSEAAKHINLWKSYSITSRPAYCEKAARNFFTPILCMHFSSPADIHSWKIEGS